MDLFKYDVFEIAFLRVIYIIKRRHLTDIRCVYLNLQRSRALSYKMVIGIIEQQSHDVIFVTLLCN